MKHETLRLAGLILVVLLLTEGCNGDRESQSRQDEPQPSNADLREQLVETRLRLETVEQQNADLHKRLKQRDDEAAESETTLEQELRIAKSQAADFKTQLSASERNLKAIETRLKVANARTSATNGTPRSQIKGQQIDKNEFLDDVEDYKGKTIAIHFLIDQGRKAGSSIFIEPLADDGLSIRDFVGGELKFGEIVVSIPKGLKMPRAHYLQFVTVVFICRKGLVESGNEAVSIQRKK